MDKPATHRDQPANLCQRVRRVVNPQVKNGVVPRTAGAFRLDDQNRRRLTPTDIAVFSLGRVERREQSIDQPPFVPRYASAIAGHTVFFIIMLACTENPSPTM